MTLYANSFEILLIKLKISAIFLNQYKPQKSIANWFGIDITLLLSLVQNSDIKLKNKLQSFMYYMLKRVLKIKKSL